jgi:hypothetical protein
MSNIVAPPTSLRPPRPLSYLLDRPPACREKYSVKKYSVSLLIEKYSVKVFGVASKYSVSLLINCQIKTCRLLPIILFAIHFLSPGRQKRLAGWRAVPKSFAVKDITARQTRPPNSPLAGDSWPAPRQRLAPINAPFNNCLPNSAAHDTIRRGVPFFLSRYPFHPV